LPTPGIVTADPQLSCLSISPAYSSSSSMNSSPAGRSTAAGGSGSSAHAADALSSLCDAVADLQLKQGVPNLAANSTAVGVAPPRAPAAAGAAGAAAGPQDSPTVTAAGSVFIPVSPGLMHTPLHTASGPAATPAPTAAQEAASSSDDDAGPLTLGRRTQPRVFRRPMFIADTDTSGSGCSSSDEAEQCSSTGHGHKYHGSCGRSRTHRYAGNSAL
jgi:hypothetical protein